jgi:tetratricopeptide (TPR) repeat protein
MPLVAFGLPHPVHAQPQHSTQSSVREPHATGPVQLDADRASVAPGTAPASENTDAMNTLRVQAHQRFETGMKLYEDGDFSLALLEFERAYALIPEYRVLYNIGQLNIQLGRYARAVKRLRQYLVEAGPRVSEERRKAVESDLEMLAARTATMFVHVNVAGAEIALDNDVIGSSPMHEPALVDAGEHRLSVRKRGYETRTESVALTGRDHATFTFNLLQEQQPSSIARTVVIDHPSGVSTDTAAIRRAQLLTAGWAGTGLLGIAWAASAYMGLHTDKKRDARLESATTPTELADLKHEARNWFVAADVFGALTLGATATLLYVTYSPPKRAPSSRAPLAPLRADVAVSAHGGTLRLTF